VTSNRLSGRGRNETAQASISSWLLAAYWLAAYILLAAYRRLKQLRRRSLA